MPFTAAPHDAGETIIARSTEPWHYMPDFLTGNRLDHFIAISDEERLRHVAVIGRTGVGKSVLFQDLMYQKVLRGRGFALIEPHGDLSRNVLDCVPAERLELVFLGFIWRDPRAPATGAQQVVGFYLFSGKSRINARMTRKFLG